MGYHFTQYHGHSQNTENSKYGKDVKKLNPCALLVAVCSTAAAMEHHIMVP
jgi:hypothetical protein